MSNTVTSTSVIKASPDRVRAAILDIEGYPAWQREMKSVVVKERDAEGRPKTVVFDVAVAGQSAGYTLEYSYPAENVIKSTLSEGSLITKQDQSYTLTEVDGGTQMEYDLDIAVKWDIPDFMLNAIIKKGVKTTTGGVKKNAEA
jgi:hypothetical protein